MFDQILGLPAHPLMIHAAVVLTPLLVLLAAGYAVVPRIRGRLDWAVVLLAIATPAAVVAAKESGEHFLGSRFGGGLPDGLVGQRIAEHESFANPLLLTTAGLGLVSLLLVFAAPRLGRAAGGVLSVLTVVFAVATGYYVLRAGHSGATAVWAS